MDTHDDIGTPAWITEIRLDHWINWLIDWCIHSDCIMYVHTTRHLMILAPLCALQKRDQIIIQISLVAGVYTLGVYKYSSYNICIYSECMSSIQLSRYIVPSGIYVYIYITYMYIVSSAIFCDKKTHYLFLLCIFIYTYIYIYTIQWNFL